MTIRLTFEDGDITEWSGDTGDYAVTTTNPFTGDYSLDCTTASAGTRTITRTDVSWGPADESTLHCWINREHSASLLFGVQSDDAYYYAQLTNSGTSDTDCVIANTDNGFTSLAATTLGIDRTQHTWLRVVVDWTADGTITVTVYDEQETELGSVTVTDTTYGDGGVGVDIYTGDSTDRTTHLDSIKAGFPQFFPEWTAHGERPPADFSYQGGDGLNAATLNYLFYNVHKLNKQIKAEFASGIDAHTYKGLDIDENADGCVDAAEWAQAANATSYKGNDIAGSDGVCYTADEVKRFLQTCSFDKIRLKPEQNSVHETFVPSDYVMIFDHANFITESGDYPQGVAMYAKNMDNGDVQWYSRIPFYEPPVTTSVDGPTKVQLGIENYSEQDVTVSGSISYVVSD